MSVNQPQFPPNIVLDALQIFANTAWHNPVAFLRTHHSSTSRDVEYLDVQNHSVALQYLFGNASAQYKILVRDEYRGALQALQSDSAYKRGVFIIGQPGIGKTCFLIYTLIKRLSEHKPVAIQLRASDHFYAFFSHTCTLCSLSDPAPLLEEDVWALSDLRASTTTPLDIFLDVSVKVIQANPCSGKHWERWSRHRGAEMFVMNVWLAEEIADLASLLALNAEEMVTLSSKWGGVPRMLLQQHTKSESQQDWELRRAATCAIENHTVLHTLEAQDIGTISTIFFILPPKDHDGNICRSRYVVRVPTAALQNALATTLQQMQSKARTDFFLHMFDNPGTRVCARNIYANWFYSQLTCGRGLYCSWLYHHYDGENIRLLDKLRDATKVKDIPIIWDITEITSTPCVWICPRGKIPAVDCAVITNSAIFAFQANTCFQPPSSSIQAALEMLKKHLPETWRNNRRISWIFSFLAISDELLTNVPSNDVSSSESSRVYVGSCGVIDPAKARIPYEGLTYEDELEVDYEA